MSYVKSLVTITAQCNKCPYYLTSDPHGSFKAAKLQVATMVRTGGWFASGPHYHLCKTCKEESENGN